MITKTSFVKWEIVIEEKEDFFWKNVEFVEQRFPTF